MADDFVNPFAKDDFVNPFSEPSKSQQGWGQTALDVGKQALSGVAQGIEALPGAVPSLLGMAGRGVEAGVRALGLETPEVAEQIRQREALGREIQNTVPTLEKSGLLPKPETTAGEYARTVGEFVPAAMAGPGSLVRRAVTQAAVPGITSEAAGQATAGTQAEPWARLAATFAGAPFGRYRTGEVRPVHLSEDLFDHGRGYYKQIEDMDLRLKPSSVADVADQIHAKLSRKFNPVQTPETFAIVNDLQKLREAPEGAFVTANDFDAARQQLREAMGSSNRREGVAGLLATKTLDDYLANLPRGHVLNGDPQTAAKLFAAARDDWAAAYRQQIVAGKLMLGHFNADTSHSGLNLDNSIRQAVKQLIRPNKMGDIPARRMGFNDEEIAAMEQVVRGTVPRNLIRYVGNLMGGGGGLGQALFGLGALGMGYYEGDPKWALLAPIGLLARKGANRITDAEAANLAALVGRRSTLGRATPAQIMPSQAGQLGTAEAMRAGMESERKHGGRVEHKATKTEANYHGGTKNKRCGVCTMFRPPSSCTAVRGQISPHGWCKFFEHVPSRADGGKITTKYDVVSGAVEDTKTGEVEEDRHIPEDDRKHIAAHERAEAKAMARGVPYKRAHEKYGIPAERRSVERAGKDWKEYSERIAGVLSHVEHEHVCRAPRHPHVDPQKAVDA